VLSTNDMNVVLEEQRDILEEFKDDFGKHLDENEKEETDFTLLGRINRVFDSIPACLLPCSRRVVRAGSLAENLGCIKALYMKIL